LKYLFSALIIINLSGNLNAQINSNLYLKDGTNFTILKAINLGNDSISIMLENKTSKRVSIINLYKIIMCESYAKIPDTLNTVALVTGVKYAAIYAFNFHKGTVNLKLASGEIKNVPIEMIESFTPVGAKFYNIESGKLNYSFGLHALYSGSLKNNAPAFELSALYKMNALLDLNLFAGIYLIKINSANYTELEHIDNFHIPKTTHQLKANKQLNVNDYARIDRNGNLFKHMTYVGAKAYVYLFGYKFKNYIGLGSNYYFGSSQSLLNAETKWIECERNISVYDSATNKTDEIKEPVFAKSTQNATYTRKAFALFNASYKLRYWVSKNCFMTNEIGMLLGRVKVNVDYQQNNEYQYVSNNHYQDETSSKLVYNYDTKIPFNQLYFSVGLYFNK
jgi:hypothetical protein